MRSQATIIPYSPSRLDSTIFFKKNLSKYLSQSKNILDIGCGKLFFFNFLKDTNFNGYYFGIDIQSPPKLSKTLFKAKTVKADFLKYPIRSRFDLVVCLWVLEHIKEDDRAISKASKTLKRGGIFVIAAPSIWSWPFEFGRHGHHYYSFAHLEKLTYENGFIILESYSSAGILGFIFMVIYNWPRYFLLLPALIIYKVLKTLKVIEISWGEFSKKLISSTIYRYHRSKTAINIHNKIVSSIVKLDSSIKLFPASYILILKKQ